MCRLQDGPRDSWVTTRSGPKAYEEGELKQDGAATPFPYNNEGMMPSQPGPDPHAADYESAYFDPDGDAY